MLMVKAGDVVDKFINDLVPLLEKGDIIIDGGNSLYTDSNRRTKDLVCSLISLISSSHSCLLYSHPNIFYAKEEKGLLFIGTGVSGGEEGALKGPSIMPGGSHKVSFYFIHFLVPLPSFHYPLDCIPYLLLFLTMM